MSRYKRRRIRHNRAWKREQRYSVSLLKYDAAWIEYAADVVRNIRATARMTMIRSENDRMFFNGDIYL